MNPLVPFKSSSYNPSAWLSLPDYLAKDLSGPTLVEDQPFSE